MLKFILKHQKSHLGMQFIYIFFSFSVRKIKDHLIHLSPVCLQAEACRPPALMGPSAPLSEGPPQQPPQGAGQCAQLGLGKHSAHPLPAASLAPSAPCHRAGDARLKVCTVYTSIHIWSMASSVIKTFDIMRYNKNVVVIM